MNFLKASLSHTHLVVMAPLLSLLSISLNVSLKLVKLQQQLNNVIILGTKSHCLSVFSAASPGEIRILDVTHLEREERHLPVKLRISPFYPGPHLCHPWP